VSFSLAGSGHVPRSGKRNREDIRLLSLSFVTAGNNQLGDRWL